MVSLKDIIIYGRCLIYHSYVWLCPILLIPSLLRPEEPRSVLAMTATVSGKKYNWPMRAAFPVTVHLLFFREDQVLLLRRFNTGYADGQYSVPAGHLDGGETVIAAAAREAAEETGVRIAPEDVIFSSVMHRRDGDERVDFFVRLRHWQGEPTNTEPDKCDELRWVRLGDLPENIIPYVRKAIQNHRDGIKFDEFGW